MQAFAFEEYANELRMPRITVMKSERAFKPGINMSLPMKEAMVKNVRLKLKHKRLVLHEQIFTQSFQTRDDALKEMRRQFYDFIQVRKEAPDGNYFVAAKHTYTGKLSGPDDLMMATLIVSFAPDEFFNNPAFSAHH